MGKKKGGAGREKLGKRGATPRPGMSASPATVSDRGAEPSLAGAGGELRRRFLDWLTTSGPGVIIIVGMMLMAIGDPWAPRIMGAGVAIQVAFLVWRLVSLRSRGRAEPGRGQVKR